MPFAAALRKSLDDRGSELAAEFMRGDSLEEVLNRHLMTVEQMGGDDVFTCILLLSPDGKRLSYGAAPTVPASYCRASESIEIGPYAGSCGAAAYLGQPVYSIDIANDPIFRSCWSTPIRNSSDAIIGTFAILHRTVGKPTRDEIQAIDMITEHVADAIMWFREHHDFEPAARRRDPPALRLVSDNQEFRDPAARLLALSKKLQSKAADLERYADRSDSESDARNLRKAAEFSRRLVDIIMRINLVRPREPLP